MNNKDIYDKFKAKCLDKNEKEKFSKRNSPNSMTIAVTRLWRPNNYRRGIDFKLQNNSTSISCGTLKDFNFKQSEHSNIITIYFSDNITIMVYKSKMVGIWSQKIINGIKETFKLTGRTIHEVNSKIDEKKLEIIGLIEGAMSLILSRLDLVLTSDFYKVRGEDWTRGDSFIDRLPRDVIIHEDTWKKVYDEGIEVTGRKGEDSTERLKQHITNSILYDFAPLIAEELRDLKMLQLDIKNWCKDNIQSIQDVFKHEPIISALPESKRLEVTEWLFENFNSNYDCVFDDIEVVVRK